MTQLFWNTITENMRLVLHGFMQTQVGTKFYLAGGTALSLQVGHRHSVDLDFFSPTEDIPSIRPALENALSVFHPTLADSAWIFRQCRSRYRPNFAPACCMAWRKRIFYPTSQRDWKKVVVAMYTKKLGDRQQSRRIWTLGVFGDCRPVGCKEYHSRVLEGELYRWHWTDVSKRVTL